MNAEDQFDRIKAIYPDAVALVEGGRTFVHLPGLVIATRAGPVTRDALLPRPVSEWSERAFPQPRPDVGP